MDILNKTGKPVRIPLAGGKRLFLKGRGMGQISPKAAEEPGVKALIEAGTIEIQGVSPKGVAGGSDSNASASPKGNGSSSGGVRHTGDR